MTKPWQTVPTEIISLALEHLHGEREADQRVAFLLLDVGVETLFKTFLTLPEKTTGTKLSFNDRKQALEGNFHELCAGLERAASARLQDDDLETVQWFHTQRNQLYHAGLAITIPKSSVQEYAKLSVDLLHRLLDVDLTDELVRAKVFDKQTPARLAGTRRLYQEFFADLLERFKAKRPSATQAKKTQPWNWFSFASGRQNISFGWSFGRDGVLRVEITFWATDEKVNKAIFDTLEKQKAEIEQQIGMSLTWDRMNNHIHSRIRAIYPSRITDDIEKLERAKEWAVDTMVKFYDTFQPRIKEF